MNTTWPDHKNKPSTYTDIDGNKIETTIEDEIVKPQGSGPEEKLVYLQKIRFKDGHLEYRFTYFMKARKGERRGHWVFGRNSLVIPPVDLAWLLNRAKAEGWEGF